MSTLSLFFAPMVYADGDPDAIRIIHETMDGIGFNTE